MSGKGLRPQSGHSIIPAECLASERDLRSDPFSVGTGNKITLSHQQQTQTYVPENAPEKDPTRSAQGGMLSPGGNPSVKWSAKSERDAQDSFPGPRVPLSSHHNAEQGSAQLRPNTDQSFQHSQRDSLPRPFDASPADGSGNFFVDFRAPPAGPGPGPARRTPARSPPRSESQTALGKSPAAGDAVPPPASGRPKTPSRPRPAPGQPEVVGLHVPLRVGLRVRPMAGGGPAAGGREGMVTVVSEGGDACFVLWDGAAEERGWYRCGVRGKCPSRPPHTHTPSHHTPGPISPYRWAAAYFLRSIILRPGGARALLLHKSMHSQSAIFMRR